jgi:hypothetical protein
MGGGTGSVLRFPRRHDSRTDHSLFYPGPTDDLHGRIEEGWGPSRRRRELLGNEVPSLEPSVS